MAHVGNALDVITSPIRGAGSVLSSVTPDWVKDAVDDGATWIGDAAKTPLGFQVLSVISLGAGQGLTLLAPIIGPGVMMVATATPGLAAGEDFTTAYTQGLVDQLEKLAAITSGGTTATASVTDKLLAVKNKTTSYSQDLADLINRREFQEWANGISNAAKRSGLTAGNLLQQLGITPEKTAQQFGVPPDKAALATNAGVHEIVYDVHDFDPVTGERPPLPVRHEGSLGLLEAIAAQSPTPENLKRLDDENARIDAAIATERTARDALLAQQKRDVDAQRQALALIVASQTGTRLRQRPAPSFLSQIVLTSMLLAPAVVPFVLLHLSRPNR